MPAQNNANSNQAQQDPNIDVTTPYTPRRPAPIVSISLNHPIATSLRKIKNFLTHKQTLFSTSFTIKVTPIVAIVSFLGIAALFGGSITTAFNFGKTFEQKFLASIPTPTPKVIVSAPAVITISRAGVVKATYQLPPQPSPEPSINTEAGSASALPSTAVAKEPSRPVLHYVLASGTQSLVFLNANPSVKLQNYENLRVLITGSFDSSKNTLFVAKPEDIEVLQ